MVSGSNNSSGVATAANSKSSIFFLVISFLYIIWIGSLLFNARSIFINLIASLAYLVDTDITIPLPLEFF